MYKPERLIAIGYCIEDNSEGNNIVYLFKGKILVKHFFIDTVIIFVSAQHLTF